MVFLARHGQAESVHPQGDRARAVTAAGHAHLLELSRSLRHRMNVTRVVCSPFARARQTAEVWGQALGVSVSTDDGLCSGASSGAQVLALARSFGGGVLLVGHNPEMAEAVSIAAGRSMGFSPGTVAAVELFDGGRTRLAWTHV